VQMIKLLVPCLIMLGISLFSASTVYAQTRGELSGNHVRVRETPTLEYDCNILFQVSRGQSVEVLDIAGEFYRVNIRDEQNVYIFREFIKITETIGITDNDVTPIVAAPEACCDIIGFQDAGAILQVTGRYQGWYEVRYNGERGFVNAQLVDVKLGDSLPTVRPPRVNSALSSSGVLADDLISYAKSYLGTPYRFGSTDPARGFDCSGFVTVVMRQFGIDLQRSSASMAADNGHRVERNALEPGDLVFFATGGGSRVSHVGIYIGGNQFIHSESRNGVVITSMNKTYWRNRYVSANRVF